MNRRIVLIFVLGAVLSVAPVLGQSRARTSDQDVPPKPVSEVSSSAAFAEVILRRTELESSLEELLIAYQEEFPKVKQTRYELGLLDAELSKMSRMKAADAAKLTPALGKLLVKRAEVATDYWITSNRYNETHPDTKKAKRKLEIYDKAISRIL